MAATAYPGSLDSTGTLPSSISDTANLNSPNHADMHEVTNTALVQIETKVGTGSSTAATGAVLIGTGSGASAWDTTPTFVGTVTVGGVVDITDTTDSSDATGDTGALRCEGGASIAKKLYVGTDADIDGTLEADAITVDGTALNEYIADTVGAMVGSNTETNITVTYEDGDNTLDFVIGTLNQDTTGTAALATSVTVSANNSTDETVYPLFVDGATGTQGAETDTGFSYNPSSGNLTIGGELVAASLDISGNIDVDGTTNLDVVDVDGQLTVADGSTSAPSIANDGDANTGMYFPADEKIGFTTGGTTRVQIETTSSKAVMRFVGTEGNNLIAWDNVPSFDTSGEYGAYIHKDGSDIYYLAGTFTPSTREVKKNITDASDLGERFLNNKFYQYEYDMDKLTAKAPDATGRVNGGETYEWFIAEEVKENTPELVGEDNGLPVIKDGPPLQKAMLAAIFELNKRLAVLEG